MCVCVLEFSFVCTDFGCCAQGLFQVRRCLTISFLFTLITSHLYITVHTSSLNSSTHPYIFMIIITNISRAPFLIRAHSALQWLDELHLQYKVYKRNRHVESSTHARTHAHQSALCWKRVGLVLLLSGKIRYFLHARTHANQRYVGSTDHIYTQGWSWFGLRGPRDPISNN